MKKFYYVNIDNDDFYESTKNIISEELLDNDFIQTVNKEDILYIGEFEKWEDAVAYIIKYGYLSLKERG